MVRGDRTAPDRPILDARVLAAELSSRNDACDALAAYQAHRLPATSNVVRMNRQKSADAILREVYLRSGTSLSSASRT